MVNYKIILASNSPRRKELLAGLDVDFEVRVLKGVDESYPATLPTAEIAEYIALKKAAAYREAMAADELIITADTIVVLNDEVLEGADGRRDRLLRGDLQADGQGGCLWHPGVDRLCGRDAIGRQLLQRDGTARTAHLRGAEALLTIDGGTLNR